MSYVYKRDFLGKWMKKNGITSYALAEILHLKSTNNIDMWAGFKPPRETKKEPKEDQDWLPLIHILRMCNHYPDLKLSDFIENAEDPKPARRRQEKDNVESALRQIIDALKEAIASHKKTIAAQEETIRNQKLAIDMLQQKQNRTEGVHVSPHEG